MPRLITDAAALSAIEAEYNRCKAWQGRLQLAFIEKALHDAPDASLLGFDVRELMLAALALRKHGFTPEELHDIAGNMDSAFDLVKQMLDKEQQELLDIALAAWHPAPEE